jgi:hypothetical protein
MSAVQSRKGLQLAGFRADELSLRLVNASVMSQIDLGGLGSSSLKSRAGFKSGGDWASAGHGESRDAAAGSSCLAFGTLSIHAGPVVKDLGA